MWGLIGYIYCWVRYSLLDSLSGFASSVDVDVALSVGLACER